MAVKLAADSALEKCMIAFGSGLGPMKFKDDVVVGLRWRFRKNFEKKFETDPNGWETDKEFLLDISRSIGRAAAANAASLGDLSVAWKKHVRGAIQMVIAPYQPTPGRWCEPPLEPEPEEIQ